MLDWRISKLSYLGILVGAFPQTEMTHLHTGEQKMNKSATCPKTYRHRGWEGRWFQPLPLSHAVAGSHHPSHPLFLSCLPVLSTTKPGGPNILWTPLPFSHLSNYQNLSRLISNPTSSRKPPQTPLFGTTLSPARVLRWGVLSASATIHLVLGHFSVGLSAWRHNHRAGSVCS